MAEQSEDNKYIKCSKCKMIYINDEEHIKSYLGYNRLGEQFKCCIKCRAINREYIRKWCEKKRHNPHIPKAILQRTQRTDVRI